LELKCSNKCVEKSALDLTAGYVGQTKSKVQDLLKEAQGGVLFIDEAYNLGKGQFGKEACDTLVQAMTSDEFADVLIIIAGYTTELNEMLNSNEGLKSRFTDFFDFPDWSPSDCTAFFKSRMAEENFVAGEGVYERIEEACGVLVSLDGWGNGRDVMSLWRQAKSERADRVHDSGEVERKIIVEDLNDGINAMIKARIPGSTFLEEGDGDPLSKLDELYRMDGIKEKLVKMKKAWLVAKREGGEAPKLGHFVFRGAPGT
jgi:ATPase family associated with various cellular activities (AAA)